MMTDGPLGRIYDLDEAAAYLRTTKQMVSRVARRHGLGTVFGRAIRFSGDDLQAIWDAMRIRPTQKLPVQRVSEPLSDDKAYERLLARAHAKRAERVAAREARRKPKPTP